MEMEIEPQFMISMKTSMVELLFQGIESCARILQKALCMKILNKMLLKKTTRPILDILLKKFNAKIFKGLQCLKTFSSVTTLPEVQLKHIPRRLTTHYIIHREVKLYLNLQT